MFLNFVFIQYVRNGIPIISLGIDLVVSHKPKGTFEQTENLFWRVYGILNLNEETVTLCKICKSFSRN